MNYCFKKEDYKLYSTFLANNYTNAKELLNSHAPIKFNELEAILKSVTQLDEPNGVSVPSTSDISNLFRLMIYLHKHNAAFNYEIGEAFNISTERARRYINTGRYFGFIEKVNENKRTSKYQLTKKGTDILSMDERNKIYMLISTILQFAPYRNSLLYYLENKQLPSYDTIIDIMVDADVRYIYADSTFESRARVILKTIIFICSNIKDWFQHINEEV